MSGTSTRPDPSVPGRSPPLRCEVAHASRSAAARARAMALTISSRLPIPRVEAAAERSALRRAGSTGSRASPSRRKRMRRCGSTSSTVMPGPPRSGLRTSNASHRCGAAASCRGSSSGAMSIPPRGWMATSRAPRPRSSARNSSVTLPEKPAQNASTVVVPESSLAPSRGGASWKDRSGAGPMQVVSMGPPSAL